MRKVLLSAVAMMGLVVTASVAGSVPAAAQPYGYGYGHGAIVQPAQYHDWRRRERERRHWEWRQRRHEEWRYRHGGPRGYY